MDAPLRHVAINADDVGAARAFYEAVFGWSFAEYAPGFLRSERPDGTVCAIQQRRELGGMPMRGLECTFAVEDVHAFASSPDEEPVVRHAIDAYQKINNYRYWRTRGQCEA